MPYRDIKKENVNLFNKIAKTYDKGIIKRWSLTIQERIISSLKIKSNSKILDIGCGTGNLLVLLSKKNEEENKNLELYGIDISQEMLRITKTKLGNKAELKVVSVEKMNYKSKFDCVFSIDAFHHYYNQDLATKKMINSLKNKGRLVIVDIDFGSIFNRIFSKIEPGNNKIASRIEMVKLFKANKLRNISQKKIWFFTFMTIGEK